MKFHTKPWKHQVDALEFLMNRDSGALYTLPGSGKTKIMIDLIVNRRFKNILIIAPKKVCSVWPVEFSKHAPSRKILIEDVSNLSGERKVATVRERRNSLGKDASLVTVVNYDSVWREPFRTYLRKNPPECVICDESHRIKGAGSKVSKFLALLGKAVKYKYLVTGTPIHESPLDAYGQYRFLDSRIFGTNYDNFRYEYGVWVRRDGYDMLNKDNPYKNMEDFKKKFFSVAFVADAKLDLPPVMDIELKFDLDPKAKKLYTQLKKDKSLKLSDDKYVTPKNILSVINSLQMLTSGYLRVEDEDGNSCVEEIHSGRKEMLRELLEDLPLDESVVVFCKYKKDISNVRETVKTLGRGLFEISGSRNDYTEFKKSARGSVVVVQISAGAEGIDLTEARYCVYYSLTHSNLSYDQSRFRVHRPGQLRPVTYYTLLARGTIDESIQDALVRKTDLVNEIMKNRDL